MKKESTGNADWTGKVPTEATLLRRKYGNRKKIFAIDLEGLGVILKCLDIKGLPQDALLVEWQIPPKDETFYLPLMKNELKLKFFSKSFDVVEEGNEIPKVDINA